MKPERAFPAQLPKNVDEWDNTESRMVFPQAGARVKNDPEAPDGRINMSATGTNPG